MTQSLHRRYESHHSASLLREDRVKNLQYIYFFVVSTVFGVLGPGLVTN
jgi:hypothetical protein